MLPFLPGHSGGEIRDYHLLKHLATIADIKLISLTSANPQGRQNTLLHHLIEYWDPAILASRRPVLINNHAIQNSWFTRLLGFLILHNIPVWGLKYHRDVSLVSRQVDAYMIPMFRQMLKVQSPDYIFVTPQLNPVLLRLGTSISSRTRTILLSYDVEASRLESIAGATKGLASIVARQEANRAERFERDHLSIFDGVVVVSDLDKETIMDRYKFESNRILVVENSIDTEYFTFNPSLKSNDSNIVFIGNLSYWPNHDAAMRLLKDIMPRIRLIIPEAKAWIVGSRPCSELETLASPRLDFITGQVDDVRPYLREASVICIPLRAGSGTKYKVLEALSAGRPVVCTSLAAEGLNLQSGTHMLLAENDEEIANACISILRQPELVRKLTVNGRKQVERFYTWKNNLENVDEWLKNVRQMPKLR